MCLQVYGSACAGVIAREGRDAMFDGSEARREVGESGEVCLHLMQLAG